MLRVVPPPDPCPAVAHLEELLRLGWHVVQVTHATDRSMHAPRHGALVFVARLAKLIGDRPVSVQGRASRLEDALASACGAARRHEERVGHA